MVNVYRHMQLKYHMGLVFGIIAAIFCEISLLTNLKALGNGVKKNLAEKVNFNIVKFLNIICRGKAVQKLRANLHNY